MKHAFSILMFLFLISVCIGQDKIQNYQGFAIEQNQVFWSQVFHVEDSVKLLPAKLFDHLKQKSWIENLAWDGNDIVGQLSSYKPDYKRYGGKFMNTSSIIRTGIWRGKVRINFKEGKYRVLVFGLQYKASKSQTGSGKAVIEQHEVTGTVEEFVLDDFRHFFRKSRMKDLDILHVSFKDSFTLTFYQIIDSDW